MALKYIRKHILSMKPYEPILPLDVLSEKLGIPDGELIKLDANENPYGMPPSSKRRLADLSSGHIYPDPESRYLRQRLSAYLQVPFENIVVGAGADELIDLTLRLTLDPGENIINCPPTFGFYDAIAQVNNLEVFEIWRKPDFSLNYPEIEKSVQKGGRLIFLANPNNPDGGVINPATLIKILSLPLLVVVDEAYIEFAKPCQSLMSEVLSRDNLIVLRTFSKWGGLAGLRLGYGVFPAPVAQEIMKIKPPYNVSVAASEAGLGALDDITILTTRLESIIKERERLVQGLKRIKFLSPYPTCSNFVLCKVLRGEAKELKKDLSHQGILIRYFNKPNLEDHVRFSVGKPEDTDRLLETLEDWTP
jgi:histidinol-phosphate aminotransferase